MLKRQIRPDLGLSTNWCRRRSSLCPCMSRPLLLTFQVVESKDLSSRDDPGSSFGQQKSTNQPTASKSLPLGAKGNAAKIFSAAIPRGESLANFLADSGDAQSDMKQRGTLELVGSNKIFRTVRSAVYEHTIAFFHRTIKNRTS